MDTECNKVSLALFGGLLFDGLSCRFALGHPRCCCSGSSAFPGCTRGFLLAPHLCKGCGHAKWRRRDDGRASGELLRARFEPRSLRASVEARRLALGGVAGWGVPGGALPGWMATGALPPPLWHHWCQHHLQRATRQTRHPSVVHRTVEGLLFSLTRLIWQRTQRAFPLSPPSHLHGFPFSCGKQAKAPVSRAAGSPSSYYPAYAALSGAHFALSRWLWDSS